MHPYPLKLYALNPYALKLYALKLYALPAPQLGHRVSVTGKGNLAKVVPASKVVSLFTLLAIAWHKGQPYWTKVDWNASLIA